MIRLKRAVQLLKEDTHTITEIAEMTGFSDAKYFREVFKKHYNVSPSQYGKEKKQLVRKEEKRKNEHLSSKHLEFFFKIGAFTMEEDMQWCH